MSYASAFGLHQPPYVAESYGSAFRLPSVDAYYGGVDQLRVPTYYGAEGATPQDQGGGQDMGQGGGMQGGGGDASGAGAIMAAIAPIIDGVTSAVATGVAMESTPKLMAKGNMNKFAKNKAALKRVLMQAGKQQDKIDEKMAELATIKADSDKKAKEKADWLRNPSKRLQWRSDKRPPAPGIGVFPTPGSGAGQKCPPLYYGLPARTNPGGHAKGLSTTWCPTHVSAYKDPAKAAVYKEEIRLARTGEHGLLPSFAAKRDALIVEINVAQDKLDRILFTRAGTNPGAASGDTGNANQIRANLLKNWGVLMGIKAYAPLLSMDPNSAGAEMLMFQPPEEELVGQETLDLLWPGTVDTSEGRIPFTEAARVLTVYLDLYNNPLTKYQDPQTGQMVSVMARSRPPLWALGLNASDQRIVGISPPLWLVELLALQGLTVTPDQVATAASLQSVQRMFESGGVGYGEALEIPTSKVANGYNPKTDTSKNPQTATSNQIVPGFPGSRRPDGSLYMTTGGPNNLPCRNDRPRFDIPPSVDPRWLGARTLRGTPAYDLPPCDSVQVQNPDYQGPKGAQHGAAAAQAIIDSIIAQGGVPSQAAYDALGWAVLNEAMEGAAPDDVDISEVPGGGFLYNLRQALLGHASQLGAWSAMQGPPPEGYPENGYAPPKGKGPLLVGLGILGLGAALLWPG